MDHPVHRGLTNAHSSLSRVGCSAEAKREVHILSLAKQPVADRSALARNANAGVKCLSSRLRVWNVLCRTSCAIGPRVRCAPQVNEKANSVSGKRKRGYAWNSSPIARLSSCILATGRCLVKRSAKFSAEVHFLIVNLPSRSIC